MRRATDPAAAAAFREEMPAYWRWRAGQVGIGGAATVGGAAMLAGGAGLGIGYGIGSIPIGSHTIHEHLGNGMYWVGHGVYVGDSATYAGASATWDWITDWCASCKEENSGPTCLGPLHRYPQFRLSRKN